MKEDEVRISARGFIYLKNSAFLPTSLAIIIDKAQAVGRDKYALKLSGDVAERFREIFTERLAKVGFGADYEPTDEGQLLEELIDSFYAPHRDEGDGRM